ncbi:hypothetical protein [Clostridium sp. L74]|uniref:hypothetical protein n=1 Tax=Clostridium sp. L74 TaxID=1560217 RepID=UPI0006ABD3EE|nr:hypothetical protein [Clostridium sp. L74]KOR24209.1 hypothetical protein ND00_29150 [Clostridium sp. L74]
MIKNQHIKDGFIFYEYENGAYIKAPISREPEEVIPELPKNPLKELREENEQLKKQLDDTQKSLAEMMNLIAMQSTP